MRRKTSISFGGGFSSPAGAPNNSENKGWSSERVPLPPPFYSGRSIPWKWEDAERWICSPVVTYPPEICQQRPLISSKSGPIVPLPSPIKGLAERVFRGNVHHRHSRSCVDLISEEETSSLCSKTHTEYKEEGTKEEEMMTTAAQSPVVVVSRRDIATQMSPEEISPKNLLNCLSVMEPPLLREIPCRGEVREVKMDKGGGAKMFNRPKRRVMLSSTCRVIRREQPEVEDNSEESSASSSSSSSSWDISEPSMTLSKFQREEAKIAAWENLQKAKAEAAIRELEVKLEKKKSASMDKIINKLQTAKLRAQEMRRSSVSSEHEQQQQQQQQGNIHQISRNSVKITHFVRKHTFMACFAPPLDFRKSS